MKLRLVREEESIRSRLQLESVNLSPDEINRTQLKEEMDSEFERRRAFLEERLDIESGQELQRQIQRLKNNSSQK